MSNIITLGFHDDRNRVLTEDDFKLSVLENDNRREFQSLPKNSQYWICGIDVINAAIFTYYR